MLYVFVVIEHGTRRLAHVNVTAHPSASWTLQQLKEVNGDTDNHKYLIHDRDAIFARYLDDSIRAPWRRSLAISDLKPEGERNLRAGHRNDPTGVSGLDDSDFRGAFACDARRVGDPLQRSASA